MGSAPQVLLVLWFPLACMGSAAWKPGVLHIWIRVSEYLKLQVISAGIADLTSVLVRKMAFAFAFQNVC